MIEVLVFDLDDTLYPERDYVLSGFRAAAAWLESEWGQNGFGETASMFFEKGERGNVFNLALNELGVVWNDSMIAELVSVYRNHMPEIKLFDDACWALETYHEYKEMALLSDGYIAVQQRKVEALGVAPYFDAIVYSDYFGRESWKPSNRPFEEVMLRLGVEGRACVYIADNPAKDFIAAKRLDWKAIQISRPGCEYKNLRVDDESRADYEIKTLRELERIVE